MNIGSINLSSVSFEYTAPPHVEIIKFGDISTPKTVYTRPHTTMTIVDNNNSHLQKPHGELPDLHTLVISPGKPGTSHILWTANKGSGTTEVKIGERENGSSDGGHFLLSPDTSPLLVSFTEQGHFTTANLYPKSITNTINATSQTQIAMSPNGNMLCTLSSSSYTVYGTTDNWKTYSSQTVNSSPLSNLNVGNQFSSLLPGTVTFGYINCSDEYILLSYGYQGESPGGDLPGDANNGFVLIKVTITNSSVNLVYSDANISTISMSATPAVYCQISNDNKNILAYDYLHSTVEGKIGTNSYAIPNLPAGYTSSSNSIIKMSGNGNVLLKNSTAIATGNDSLIIYRLNSSHVFEQEQIIDTTDSNILVEPNKFSVNVNGSALIFSTSMGAIVYTYKAETNPCCETDPWSLVPPPSPPVTISSSVSSPIVKMSASGNTILCQNDIDSVSPWTDTNSTPSTIWTIHNNIIAEESGSSGGSNTVTDLDISSDGSPACILTAEFINILT